VVTEQNRQPSHALPSNQPDFSLDLFGLDGNHGREAGINEIDVIDPLVRRFKYLVDRQGQRHELG